MAEFKKGDRVKVSFEGEVGWVGTYEADVRDADADGGTTATVPISSITKIEPPVKMFRAGIVRTLDGTMIYHLLPNSYLGVNAQGATEFQSYGSTTFTSDKYELVKVVPVDG